MSRRKACDYPGCDKPWKTENARFKVRLCDEHDEQYSDFVLLPHRNPADYEKLSRVELDFMVLCGSAAAEKELKQLSRDPRAYVKRQHPHGLHTEPWKDWRISNLPEHIIVLCRRVFGISNPTDEDVIEELDYPQVVVEEACEDAEADCDLTDDLPPIDLESLDNDLDI